MSAPETPTIERLASAVTEDVIDRRQSDSSKPYSGPDRRSKTKRSVAFEVSPTGVSLAYVAETTNSQERTLITDRVGFPADRLSTLDATLDVEDLNEQIRRAVVELSDRHRLSGSSVVIGLGGAPCATRALLGDNNDVDEAREELVERSNRYLGLGRGEKVHCYVESPIDAKRKRAWVTIANQEIIDGIAHAVQLAHLRLSRMEHTLSAFCKMIHHSGFDAAEPVLVAATTEAGTELAISYQGRLLLDYHPSSSGTGDDSWAEAIRRHIKCLRRFVQTQVPADVPQITKLFVFGASTIGAEVEQKFREDYGVEVAPYDQAILTESFRMPLPMDHSAGTQAATWMAQEHLHHESSATTDLTDTLTGNEAVSVLGMLTALWPVAAALLVCLSITLWSMSKQASLASLENRIDVLRAQNVEAKALRQKLGNSNKIRKEVQSLRAKVPSLSWQKVLVSAGRSLPAGSWLENISVERDLSITISGASYSDDAIYDYIQKLNESPLFTRVSLRSTRSVQTNSGRATHFDIVAVLVPEPKPVANDAPAVARRDGFNVWTAYSRSTKLEVCNGQLNSA